LLDTRRYRCGNDMLGSWAGSLACADGISVIAGTGSMAYGEYGGRGARSGGWGELIGDEGSAYWIAREGFSLFSRMSDGRAPRGALHELGRQRFGITHDLDLCSQVYGVDANARGAFAQFARVVHEAAEAGDAAARDIFTRAARELAALVFAVRATLGVPDSVTLPVSWSGGAFAGSSRLVMGFREELAASPASYAPRTPLLPPVLGAALYAARLGGAPLDAASIENLRSQTAGLPS
jgi:N-acetylglucosamine kinase-like BadF-type ATPase